MSSVPCKICGRPLNKAQFSADRQFKSCPKCSTENGEEHVYYKYSEDFRTSEKRVTQNNPDGPQSYCYTCRERGETGDRVLCSEL